MGKLCCACTNDPANLSKRIEIKKDMKLKKEEINKDVKVKKAKIKNDMKVKKGGQKLEERFYELLSTKIL